VEVELDYWTSRKRVETEMARCAASPEARLAHEQLASHYSAKANQAKAAYLIGLVVAQMPADYVVNGSRPATIADAIAEAPQGAAL
jgi:hypothetical protein